MAHEELVNIKLITALRFGSINSIFGIFGSFAVAIAGSDCLVSGKSCRSIIDTGFKVKSDQIGVFILLAVCVIGRNFRRLI